jgi:hypothetical protein
LADSALPFSNKTHIGVVEEQGARVATVEEFRRRFGVDALIRLHSTDFALLDRVGRVFVHFNLETTLNEAGHRYAILPIIKPGSRLSDGGEVLPIVDPSRFRLGTCTAVAQRVPLDQITADQFAHSLPTIQTTKQLQAALMTRYAHMFPDLTEKEILARGCAVTRLVLDNQ